jgi:hypothetical protein
MVQVAYQDWLKKQTADIKKEAPKTLYWGQAGCNIFLVCSLDK